jgi:formamidase
VSHGQLLETSREETLNRATIPGAVEIGRLPGVVTVAMLTPLAWLAKLDLNRPAKEHYGL